MAENRDAAKGDEWWYDRATLIDFALWISNVWEKGNSDDEESAAEAVDAFLRGESNG